MTMTKLPAMPRTKKARPVHACACGCGLPTKSVWHPGHDGRATGWATRITKGLLTLEDVPANERAGAAIMLERLTGAPVDVPAPKAPRLRKRARTTDAPATEAATTPAPGTEAATTEAA